MRFGSLMFIVVAIILAIFFSVVVGTRLGAFGLENLPKEFDNSGQNGFDITNDD